QQGRGRGIDEPEHRTAVDYHVGFAHPQGAPIGRKLVTRLDLEAAATAFFLVACDALAALQAYVGHLKQRGKEAVLAVESRLASWAHVAGLLAVRTTRPAKPPSHTAVMQTTWRHLKSDDLPLGAFVVQDVGRGELAQGQEARASDEL